MLRTFKGLMVLMALALVVSACGGDTKDEASGVKLGRAKTERYLAQDIESKLEVPVSVSCPRNLPRSSKGARFSCFAFAPLSVPIAVDAKLKDSKGNFTWHMDARETLDIEKQIQTGIKSQKKLAVTVVCPRLIALDKGDTFICAAVRANGVRSDVTVTQSDSSGNVIWTA